MELLGLTIGILLMAVLELISSITSAGLIFMIIFIIVSYGYVYMSIRHDNQRMRQYWSTENDDRNK